MSATIRRLALPCAVLACSTVGASPARAQIVTENAGVVSPETPIVRESVSFLQAETVKQLRWNSQVIVAVPWLPEEFKLTVPIVYNDVDASSTGVRDTSFGLGDVSLRFKQSLWQDDGVMASTRLAALADVTAPTGEDGASDRGTRLARRLQLGSGAFGFGGGGAFTFIRDRHRLAVEAFYRHTLYHEGLRPGDTLDLNVAYWFRIEPARFSAEGGDVEIRGVIELLTSFRLQGRIGDRVTHDDGFIAWIAPGVQVYPLTWLLFEANVQVPVYQDLRDEIGKRKLAATVAAKVLF